MFFCKTLVLSTLLTSVVRAVPIPDDGDDTCWNGDESVPEAPRLPPSPKASSVPQFSASSVISVAPIASSSPIVSSAPQTPAESVSPSASEVSSLAGSSSAAQVTAASSASASPKASVVAQAATSPNTAASPSGQATFYGGNTQGGACSFSTYTLPSGMFGTALSDSNWDNSANCGACVSVTGPSGNSITALITDECPGCGENHLDLYPDAFAKLADPSTGVIDVTWNYVDCDITSPLQLHQKEGVSEYWFSMQVVNANEAVSKLEVSTDGGSTWKSTERQTYNFFEISSGTGTATADIKVTSSSGKVVTVSDIKIEAGASTTAEENF